MSNLNLDEHQGKYHIRSYKPGNLKINQQQYTHSLIVSPDNLISPWEPATATDLKKEHLNAILELRPDILLIGTGETHHILDIELYGHLLNHKIGVEVMSTRAACQTFNALSSEKRNVAAALIIR